MEDDSNEKEVNITYNTLLEFLRLEKSREELQPLSQEFYDDVADYVDYKRRLVMSNSTDSLNLGQEKASQELINTIKIIKSFYDRREKKIIDMALIRSRTGSNVIDTSPMLEEEKLLFDKLVFEFEKFRKDILAELLKGKVPGLISRESRFKSHVENFEKDESLDDYEEELKSQAEALEKPAENSGEDSVEDSAEVSESDAEGDMPDNSGKKKLVRFLKAVPKFVGDELEVYGPFEEEDMANLPEAIATVLINKGRAEEMDS